MYMQALILNAAGEPDVYDEVVPDCGEDEVLVQIRACVLTRRDMDLYTGVQSQQNGLSGRLGQGLTGIVEYRGSKVNSVTPGDRVLVCRTDAGL
ncbi:MAG TPA: hypothetical protein DIT99_14655, partial [Candidatus Latescibacteria bacterium]|nr:hypothetical protein [Candidatus Latescibacterota bacterium]